MLTLKVALSDVPQKKNPRSCALLAPSAMATVHRNASSSLGCIKLHCLLAEINTRNKDPDILCLIDDDGL